MRDYKEGVSHAVHSFEKVFTIPQHQSLFDERESILNTVNIFKPNWLIFDLPYPDMDTSYYPALRSNGMKIVFIDDFRFTNPGIDVLLNSNILAPARTEIETESQTKYFLGPEYFIFDDTSAAYPSLKNKNRINFILTFGGSDPTGITLKVIKALLTQQWPKAFFKIILGPGYGEYESVYHLIKNHRQLFGIEVNPTSTISLLQQCDFAVCAGGRTAYELLHLEKKFLPIATSDLEKLMITEFIHQGLVSEGMTIWNVEDFLEKLQKIYKSLLRS